MTWHYEPTWKLPKYEWDKERETCMACKHYHEPPVGATTKDASTVMACRLSPRATSVNHGTCISMRYDGACGKQAKLFEPKKSR